ncbi:carbohydrate ABC transporter permease [Paenibacillus sp. NPDC058174]|uniref:carbohydrate ABC transporter permease n=1 Tax=Paenibacillus sp. NPDC058174 TaxID=3346366 RepID=UPI0036DB9F21
MSFTDSTMDPSACFIGIKNYVDIFTSDSNFFHSLWITILFTFLNVLLSNLIAILLALAVESVQSRLKNVFRTLFFLPYIFALVVVGFTWKFIFIDALPDLAEKLHLPFLNIDFLGVASNAIYAIIIMNVWYTLGYFMVIYVAGLQGVDKSILESARMEGATSLTLFVKIILPLLMPAVTICVFTGCMSSFKIFDAVFVLTGGGPGYATDLLSLNIYTNAFGEFKYGYGMAKAVIMALVLFAAGFIQLKFFKEREVEA